MDVKLLTAKEATAIAHAKWLENRIIELNNSATYGELQHTIYVTGNMPVQKLLEIVGSERIVTVNRDADGRGEIRFELPVEAK